MQLNNPQFATVTFISGDDTPGNTFRVPITHETTVRQLAKDAMQRLVLSRRSAGHKQIPSIMVTEVFVRGESNQPKAEVFSQDLVTQVVLVKEEVIFMRLQSSIECKPPPPHAPAAVSSASAAPAATAPALVSAFTHKGANTSCEPANKPVKAPDGAAEKRHDPAPSQAASRRTASTADAAAAKTRTDTKPVAAPEMPKPAKSERKHGTPPVDDRATRATKRARAEASPDENDTIRKLRAEEDARRLRWGPEAASAFASNYVSSPNRLMSRRKVTRTVTAKTGAATGTSKTAQPPAKEARQDTEATTVTGDAESFTREGWGPDAYKNFAANYVTSPDRLARLIRRQKRAEKTQSKRDPTARTSSGPSVAEGTKPPTAVAPKRTVSRQLAFPVADDAAESRQTVGHGVTLIEVDDDSQPTPPPPKGWGTEASKYFDTKTYCDDPSKARLTEEERSRPMQTRHSCRL